MSFQHYIENGGKRMRCGYTTGTCAALAAAGAARLLLTGKAPENVHLITPKGLAVEVMPTEYHAEKNWAQCAVQKDAGDDIDATAELLIFARVAKIQTRTITIEGGEGIGRVTKQGLDQPIHAAAINHVPRRMICEAVQRVCAELCYEGGLSVLIFAPDGARCAEKTFNAKLGIEGGISILGTSGIVEPMSLQALIDTKKLELHQAASVQTKGILLTPGNYGLDFLQHYTFDGIENVPVVVCSNFIGECLDTCAAEGFQRVLLVGHIGKFVKLAGGIMNTHSRFADCRTELFCAHAAICGAHTALCAALMEAATADACIALLQQAKLWDAVMKSLLMAIETHLVHRAQGRYVVGAVLFSNAYGLLGETEHVKEIQKAWK